jgi:radical SAM superfamily enzyme
MSGPGATPPAAEPATAPAAEVTLPAPLLYVGGRAICRIYTTLALDLKEIDEALAAVEKTAGRGINTGAHFIFGLPGESMEEMLTEAGIISAMPLTTVKFHQLQIMKGTAMEREYIERSHEFELFTLEEYIGFFIKFLEKLNPAIVVERFTGEAPPRYMSMTPWGKMRADQVTTMIEKRLEELDTWQGRRYRPS